MTSSAAQKQKKELQEKLTLIQKANTEQQQKQNKAQTELQEQLKQQQKAANERAKELNASIQKMQQTNGELQKSLSAMTTQHTQDTKDLNTAKDQARELERQLNELKNKNGGNNIGAIIAAVVITAILTAIICLILTSTKNDMRKILLLLLMQLPIVVSAHDFEVDGIYYKIINENEVAVTYEGQYATSYQEYNGDVIIPPTVNYMSKTLTVTSVGEYAFDGCQGLTSIDIPNSVISIGKYAFDGCQGLTSIDIPNSVISIGKYVINSCNNLISITVENGNAVYDSRDNCNAVIETSSNTLIAGCKNTIIPNSVTSIGPMAFFNCGLTSVIIPNSVTSIRDGAFTYCGLTSIVIPNSVTYIGNRAFACTGLTSITVENGNAVYDSRDNCNAVIETSSNTLIAGCKNTIIPNSVTKIGIYAFEGFSGLTSIIIPNSVRSIEDCAFTYCTGLTSIDIPNSVISIGKYAFFECEGLIRVDIGNSMISIGDWAFAYCPRLKNVYCYSSIPSSCSDNCFSDYSASLHVPAASMAAYFVASCWSNFDDINGDAIVPTGISMSKDSASLQLDEQLQLTVTVTPNNASNKEITWISTDTTVATVNNGMVLAVGCGECDIIASCFGMQVMCHVLVGYLITLDQQEAMLLPNHLLTLTPTPSLPGFYIVSSSDPTVAAARVLSSGKVQVVGIKEGTTTITVGNADSTAIPATCLVTVYTETGDINCDGFVNISDVTSLIDHLLSGDDSQISNKNADVNGDENINISDVTTLIDILLSGNG